jgi:hypothetical protein
MGQRNDLEVDSRIRIAIVDVWAGTPVFDFWTIATGAV